MTLLACHLLLAPCTILQLHYAQWFIWYLTLRRSSIQPESVWYDIPYLCSLAFLDPRVGHTMDVLSPFISILCHSDWLFPLLLDIPYSRPKIGLSDLVPVMQHYRCCPRETIHCISHLLEPRLLPMWSQLWKACPPTPLLSWGSSDHHPQILQKSDHVTQKAEVFPVRSAIVICQALVITVVRLLTFHTSNGTVAHSSTAVTVTAVSDN